MPTRHIVRQGEYLSLLAQQYGFSDWNTIYSHADNAAFRETRPDPNILLPGDEVVIPDHLPKPFTCETGKLHRFRLRPRKRDELRVAIRDDGRSVASKDATVDFIDARGAHLAFVMTTTSAEGKLRVPIPKGSTHAKITVHAGETLVWLAAVGHLDPIRDMGVPFAASGCSTAAIQARLKNLGFLKGRIDGVMGPKTTAALRLFQASVLGRKDADGKLDEETCTRLEGAHGC